MWVFPQQEASICSYLNAQEPSSETKAYQSSALLDRCYGVIKNAAVATVWDISKNVISVSPQWDDEKILSTWYYR